MHIETLLAHTGCLDDPETGAIVAPIHLSTTFHRNDDGTYPRGFIYSRDNNPTRNLFEQTLALIEGGEDCTSFSSGMAATHAIIQALAPGSHVIIPDDVYHGLTNLADNMFGNWGISFDRAKMTNLDDIAQRITPQTQLIWLETPSNPMLQIADIRSITQLAKKHGVYVVVDSTWTTPLLQKPLDLGADLVIHSVTKYLAGHSDVLGGAVVARTHTPLSEAIRDIQKSCGAVMDPFSAWLTMRGMRSLSSRLKTQCQNAHAVAQFLAGHPLVEQVHYPGLSNHPGHSIAKLQMSHFGAMLSFQVIGKARRAFSVAAQTKIFQRATSLGGTESLIEHRASIEPESSQTPENLLRLSIGLEYVNDLLQDLDSALKD